MDERKLVYESKLRLSPYLLLTLICVLISIILLITIIYSVGFSKNLNAIFLFLPIIFLFVIFYLSNILIRYERLGIKLYEDHIIIFGKVIPFTYINSIYWMNENNYTNYNVIIVCLEHNNMTDYYATYIPKLYNKSLLFNQLKSLGLTINLIDNESKFQSVLTQKQKRSGRILLQNSIEFNNIIKKINHNPIGKLLHIDKTDLL